MRLLARLKAGLAARKRQRLAAEATRTRLKTAETKALAHFASSHEAAPMGAHVLHDGPDAVIVRVMYLTDHIPPDRAWYAVPASDEPPRELTFEEVSHLETRPWR